MFYCLSPAMHLLSNCCTSNLLLQRVVLPSSTSCQNQSRHLQANHLTESSRRGVLPNTHFHSVLCLATICSPSFMIIRGRTGNAEHFRVRISDITKVCLFFLKFLYMYRMKAVKTTRLVDHADSITAVLYWLPFQPSCLL